MITQEVEDFLLERGCSAGVARKGLSGLFKKWSRAVKEVEDGNMLNLDDYLNDMDARQIIEEVLDRFQHIRIPEALDRADKRFRDNTLPCDCLWGEETAGQEGWTSDKNWWYFRKPRGGFEEEA